MDKQTKFQQTAEQWKVINKQLFKDCEDYLKDVLAHQPNKTVEFDEDNMICVPYDGGSHPEYQSSMFSLVYNVHLNNKGELEVDLEDDSDYSITKLSASELCDIAEVVSAIV